MNNTAQNAFGKYCIQARGFLNDRLKYLLAERFLLYMSTKRTWTGNYEKNWGNQTGSQEKIWGA